MTTPVVAAQAVFMSMMRLHSWDPQAAHMLTRRCLFPSGSRLDRMEELRQGSDSEQVWVRSVRQAQELPPQGLSKIIRQRQSTDFRARERKMQTPMQYLSPFSLFLLFFGLSLESTPDVRMQGRHVFRPSLRDRASGPAGRTTPPAAASTQLSIPFFLCSLMRVCAIGRSFISNPVIPFYTAFHRVADETLFDVAPRESTKWAFHPFAFFFGLRTAEGNASSPPAQFLP